MRDVRLFEADPDLLGGASGADAGEVHGYIVEVRQLRVGPWEAAYDEQRAGAYALVQLGGTMSRRVTVAGRRSVELLGPGDVMRPWVEDNETVLPADVEWHVEADAAVGVLPHAFPRQVAACPRVMHVLADRMIMRSRWLAVDLAIGHGVGIERRLLLTLWHLADRWGRVTRDGVRLDLRLTHELLGDIVGARRPSVSTALGALTRSRLVEPLPESRWLLLGSPPDPNAA